MLWGRCISGTVSWVLCQCRALLQVFSGGVFTVLFWCAGRYLEDKSFPHPGHAVLVPPLRDFWWLVTLCFSSKFVLLTSHTNFPQSFARCTRFPCSVNPPFVWQIFSHPSHLHLKSSSFLLYDLSGFVSVLIVKATFSQSAMNLILLLIVFHAFLSLTIFLMLIQSSPISCIRLLK